MKSIKLKDNKLHFYHSEARFPKIFILLRFSSTVKPLVQSPPLCLVPL